MHKIGFIMSIPRNRSTPEAVVVKEDIVKGRPTAHGRGQILIGVIEGLEVLVVFHHNFGDAAASKWLLHIR